MNSNNYYENTNSREHSNSASLPLTLDSIEGYLVDSINDGSIEAYHGVSSAYGSITLGNDGGESAMSENDANEYENEEGVFHGIFLTKK